MSCADELEAEGAPKAVVDIGKECDSYVDSGMRPPAYLVEELTKWVARQQAQDRYGK